ncbi:helix-turn-helix transcriptional regulator [Planctomonas psychrotolerans]|uniref:helix-turn-helix transcriptional regulator n=1 Tax=Planctomonas psychrotolerans TaxID=2528712 RepID=UPI0012396322|nr:helix-turn-helix transcriptional regulator [Planctomonas psychrotolerans]
MGMVARGKPVELAPAPWPDIPSDDLIGEVARQLVLNLRAAIGDQSIRSVATAAGMNHVTVLNVLAGRVWPDLATIAKLERGLGRPLWPSAIAER